jgi:hypothetical protein
MMTKNLRTHIRDPRVLEGAKLRLSILQDSEAMTGVSERKKRIKKIVLM